MLSRRRGVVRRSISPRMPLPDGGAPIRPRVSSSMPEVKKAVISPSSETTAKAAKRARPRLSAEVNHAL